MTKTCINCLDEKDIADFPDRRGSKDGKRNTCRACRAKIHNEWRAKNVYQARLSRMNSYYKNREKEIAKAKANAKLNPHWGIKAAANYKKKHPYYDALKNKRARKDTVPLGDVWELDAYLKELRQECSYCGITLEQLRNNPNNYRPDKGLQIDKIVPHLGYVMGNVTLACSICNYVKGRWFGFDTMQEIGKKYVRKVWDLDPDDYL